MNDEKNKVNNKEEEKGSERGNTVKLVLTVILAFLTALLFRQSMGIWAMTPLAFIIAACAAFIGLSPLIKNITFGLLVFAVNTVEQKDIYVTLIFTALCILVRIFSDWAVSSFKKSKKRFIAIALTGSLLTAVLSFAFVGNPITAIREKRLLNDYISEKYPTDEDAFLGNIKVSPIHYNYRTGAYEMDAVSSRFPTEGGSVSISGGHISDGFDRAMEEKLTEPYVAEITRVLRSAFPDDNFGVAYEKIAHLPQEAVLAKADNELYGAIAFRISIGGIQSNTRMKTTVSKYAEALKSAGIDYYRIEFVSGTNLWVKRSITLYNNSRKSTEEAEVQYVPAFSDPQFNRYLNRLEANLLTE